MLTIKSLKEKIDKERLLHHVFLRLILIMVLPGSTLAQKNPWEQTPKGENPWTVNEKTNSEENIPQQEVIEIKPESIIDREDATSLGCTSDTVKLICNDKIRQFYLEEKGKVSLSTHGKYRLDTLKEYGKDLENANGYIVAGFFTGLFINILSVPVSMIYGSLPGKKTRQHINTFEKNNPHATEEEVKAVGKGLKRKQLAKTLIGNLFGIITNAVLIRVAVNQF